MRTIIIKDQEHFQFELFDKIDSVKHIVTGKNPHIKRGLIDGLNYGLHVPDNAEVVQKNRKEIINHFGLESAKVVVPKQTHSSTIEIVTSSNYNTPFDDVDALITNEKNIVIGILSADCVPILLLDPVERVIACIHAGWRGTVAEIAKKTVLKMCQQFGSKPQNILAGIGPSISQKNYEVGEDVSKYFSTDCLVDSHNNKKCVDLWKENKNQLVFIGLVESNIEIAGMCTYEEKEKFYSARRDTINTGRLGSFISIT